jgi:hypothetical protein
MSSDLVKKVCNAMAEYDDAPAEFVDEARAAIKAVAEWSMSNYYAETSILHLWTDVLKQLEGSK